MNSEFLERQRRSQENLVTFFRTEVDLASTFCTMAETTQSLEHRTQLLADIQKVANAICHFEGPNKEQSFRAEFNKEAYKLDRVLAQSSK